MTATTQVSMAPADQLLAIEQIKRVKNKYAHSADKHNWAEFASVFAPDGVLDESDFPSALRPFTKEPVSNEISAYLESKSGGVEWPLVGRDAILTQHLGVHPEHMMVHHVLDPNIQLTSDSTATATFRFEGHHWFPAGLPVHYMHNFGVYHETYIRLEDDQWYIKTLRLERRRVEIC